MSETPGEACGSLNCHPDPGSGGNAPELITLCDHIVNWVTSFDSTLNRVNYAEAHCTSEGDLEAASKAEEEALLEIMDFVVTVTDMHAATQDEVEGKKRTLDALTSIPAWERDSLYELRHSIERDQLEVNARLYAASLEPPHRAGWLARFNVGAGKG